MTHRYVYGIVERDGNGRTFDLETTPVGEGDEVYTIAHRRFAAVVSDIETTDPERTDEDATRHDEVLRELVEGSKGDDAQTVIPMRFGMVFESDRALKNVLRGAGPAFRRTMREIDGCVELGVKLVRETDAEVDTEEIEQAVAERLEPLAESSVANDRFSDRLVVNRSYLVSREEREAFDTAVADLEAAHDTLLVQYAGPYAPYNFVDIQVGAV
ncbi:GvpL/GvpF family gas vesicle protein [Natronobiforma cellulositropha]|uniref:GvpL/GvpF family gas vesicle protein n=1 Tax=Natronobiforma cellulositropha TaxID=1679076 RepID=UPI0021D5910C|nr:GvpL/GvpF family gas vesicle protein [Natronobiforma cellulositropha]